MRLRTLACNCKEDLLNESEADRDLERLMELAGRVGEYDITARYKYFNGILFNNELPIIPLGFSNSKTYTGVTNYGITTDENGKDVLAPNSIKVMLSRLYKMSPQQLDRTLVHEMIHVFMIAVKGLLYIDHGPEFVAIANAFSQKLGFVVPLTDTPDGLELNQPLRDLGVLLAKVSTGWQVQIYKPQTLTAEKDVLIGIGEQLVAAHKAEQFGAYTIRSERWTKLAIKYPLRKEIALTGFYSLRDPEALAELQKEGTVICWNDGMAPH